MTLVCLAVLVALVISESESADCLAFFLPALHVASFTKLTEISLK